MKFPIVRGRVIENSVLTNESEETLRRYNLPFTTSKNMIGTAALWVENRYVEVLKKAGNQILETSRCHDSPPITIL